MFSTELGIVNEPVKNLLPRKADPPIDVILLPMVKVPFRLA